MDNRTEELKSQLNGITNDITDIRLMIEKRKEAGSDYANLSGLLEDLNKQRTKIEKELGKLNPSEKRIVTRELKDRMIQEQQIRVEEQKLKAIEIAGNDKSYLESNAKLRRLAIDTVGSVGHVVSERDLADIKQGATEFFYNQHDFWNGIDHTDISLVDWLTALRDISWLVHEDSIPTYIEENVLLNLYVHYDGQYGDDSNMFITSYIMRNGKSWLRHKIVEAYTKAGVPTSLASWPKGEHADVRAFSGNLIAEIDDTSSKTTQRLDDDQLKAILRKDANSYIPMDGKNQQPVLLKSRAKVLASGNVKPPMSWDATWRVVYTNSIQAVEAAAAEELKGIVCSKDADSSLVGHRLSVDSLKELNRIFKKVRDFREFRAGREQKIEREIDYSYRLNHLARTSPNFLTLIDLIQGACSSSHIATNVRVKDLEAAQTGSNRMTCSAINSLLNELRSDKEVKGICERTNTTKDTPYMKWDVSKLYNFKADETSAPQSPIQEVLDARKLWDEIIEAAKSLDTPPKKELDNPIDTSFITPIKAPVVEPKHSYAPQSSDNPFPSMPTDGEDDELETVNPIREGCIRCDENVTEMTTYLLEADDMSLEEQYDLAERLFKAGYIWRAVDSAGKSVHCLVHVNVDAESREEYGYIHSRLNDILFGGRADRSTNNPSRGTRRPNGRRLGHGNALQKLLFINTENTVDITKLHYEWLNHEKPRRETLRNMAAGMPMRSKDCAIREWVEGWKESEFKNAALDICDGTGDHSDWMGFAPFLVRHGFGYEQIMSEIPGLDKSGWNFTRKQFDRYANGASC